MNEAVQAETLGFQAEAKQLLHLMTHSLYSNKQIFLRELISNASDAADKLRFEALARPELFESDPELRIRIEVDEAAGIITVCDNGIGMSRDEAIANLGTIARSGTAEFVAHLSGDDRKDSKLIGQFGVGFYSSFIVAKKVMVETRRAGLPADQGVRWTCDGEAEFSIETVELKRRGTSVILYLKDEDKDFANNWRLRTIIKTYSDHIAIPVEMAAPPKHSTDAEEKSKEASETVYEVVNSATALWTRPRKEISDEEYIEFYKLVSHDIQPPLKWSHNRVEGKFDYTTLLYIPGHAPFDINQREGARGLKLYVQRTFIMDDAEQFLPLYLRFIKGVVDSADLPLNISREILQKSPAVDNIRSAVTKRALEMLEDLATNDASNYGKLWDEFGSVIKEGLAEDYLNREKIAGLLRFASTHDGASSQRTSLKEYIGRMQENQEKIYYLIADSHSAALSSPYLEVLRAKGVEILLLSDRIDEWVMSNLFEFEEKQLQDISRGELDLGKLSEEGGAKEDDAEKTELVERLAKLLGDKVDSVRASSRLVDSPSCLVIGEGEIGVQMRRIMEQAGQKLPESKPILEVNPAHPLLKKFNTETDEARRVDFAFLLLNEAQLSSGQQMESPGEFIRRLNRLLLSDT